MRSKAKTNSTREKIISFWEHLWGDGKRPGGIHGMRATEERAMCYLMTDGDENRT